jgi:hypothetical protein
VVYALNAAIGLIFAWTLYRLLQQLGRGLRVGNIKGGWAHKGVAIRRSSEPLMYWMCVVALGAGAAVFAFLLGGLVSRWI